MSLIVGVVRRKGGTVFANELDSLSSSIKHLPHCAYKEIVYQNVAFGSFYTGSEQVPLYQTGEILLVAQGRIDNRSELCPLLDIEEDKLEHISDEFLIFQTYLKFRDEAPNKLLGDWSFAAYDLINNQLFLAQDPHGYTSLHYYIDSEIVIFSTLIKPLLASVHVPKTISLDRVVSMAAVYKSEDEESTFYESIKLLNPAHRMWIDSTEQFKERYWFPERLPILKNITLDNAVARLKDLFTEAVRCRLRSEKPVASMLSGGLDSGSVAAIAAELLKKEEVKLHTFSHVPLFNIDENAIGQYRFGDERPYIQENVTHSANIVPHYLDSSELTPLQGIRILLDIHDEPIHAAANAYWLVDIPIQARKQGFSTLLSGEMGNATISWTGINYALSASHILQRYGVKALIKQKWLRPLFFRIVKPFYNLLFHKDHWQEYSYLGPAFAKKVNLKERIRQSGRAVDFSAYYQDPKDHQRRTLMLGYNPRCRYGSVISHHTGVERRDPTGDKRIIEFMLQLPNELFFSNTGANKHIVKSMMKDILPDKVLFQTRKGLQSADIIERVQPDLPEIESIVRSFSTDLHPEELFDKSRILHDLQLLKEKKLPINKTFHLLRIIGIMEFLNRHKNRA